MELFGKCKWCKEEIVIKSMSNTRPELRSEKGDEFAVKCKKCNQSTKLHVNQVRARPSPIIIAAGVLLGILATISLFFLGFIAVISFSIPFYFYHSQQKNASLFNSYKVTTY